MLLKQHATTENEALKMTAVILSWGIYGASIEWKNSNQERQPEEFIKSAIPYLLAGIDSQDNVL